MLKKLVKFPAISITLIVSTLAAFAFTVYAKTDADTSREYHLKAAFLRYVAKFVTWPENFEPEDSINICTYGEVPSLKGINSINGRIVKEKPLIVRPVVKLNQSKNCQVLFITKDKEGETKSIITTLKGSPVLGFGDMEGFAEDGGAMNFYIVNNRMAIMINKATLEESKLEVAPRMLKLVTVVPNVDSEPDAPDQAA